MTPPLTISQVEEAWLRRAFRRFAEGLMAEFGVSVRALHRSSSKNGHGLHRIEDIRANTLMLQMITNEFMT